MVERNPVEPRDGEALADFINRNRPEDAPKVKGVPTWFEDLRGFGWKVAGWGIAFGVDGCIRWGKSSDLCWHELTPDGKRETKCAETWEPVF